MRIALLAHVRFPVAPPFMGGMESLTARLADTLVARGHDVSLMATGDSITTANLVPIADVHYEATMPWALYRGSDALAQRLSDIYAGACDLIADGGYDLVHYHGLHPLPIERLSADGRPLLVSLHVPPFGNLRAVSESELPGTTRFTVTSEAQRRSWSSPRSHHALDILHNGVDLARWPFSASGQGHAVWAGRLTPNKAPHLAIIAARKAGIAIRLIGSIEDPDYFDQMVRPLLREDALYVGHLVSDDLQRELAAASVFVFTPVWDEPFGLVLIEAMACGTPVASFDMGAAGEILGCCGALARAGDTDDLAAAILRARTMSRHAARQRVEQAFSMDRMVARCEDLYARCMDARQTARVPALL